MVSGVTNHPKGNRFATLMLASFWDPPNKGHYDFIKELGTPEEKGLAYGAFSLFAHENRTYKVFPAELPVQRRKVKVGKRSREV